MSKRYPGNFVTGNPVALSQTSNNGIWDIKDNYQATNSGVWQEANGIYEIPKSLRFRGSAYVNGNFASAGNRKTWTWSGWVKIGKPTAAQMPLFCEWTNGNNYFIFGFVAGALFVQMRVGGANAFVHDTDAVYRDPSAWYHIMYVFDTTQAIGSDRAKVYVNGSQVSLTAYTTNTQWPALNTDYLVNSAESHRIGYDQPNSVYFDGYITEVNFIDGQALDPSYFGYSDPVTNIWQPKKYTGSYGTNGFYLPFNEPLATSNASTAVLGRNFAGSNFIKYSQDGSQQGVTYSYIVERATQTTNAALAPDGSTTANKLLVDGTLSNTHRFYCQFPPADIPSGSTQTSSIYVKAGSGNYVYLENWNGSGYSSGYFNLTTGQWTGANQPAYMGSQYVGDGWWRIWSGLPAGSNGSGTPSIGLYVANSTGTSVTWDGDSSTYVYWWGAQVNKGVTPDPYIYTNGAEKNNDFTPNYFSITSGNTYDIMVDSPTNVFTTATDTGGVVSGNYPTLNPILTMGTSQSGATNSYTLSNANLTTAAVGSEGFNNCTVFANFTIPKSGKWYWEWTTVTVPTAAASRGGFGIMDTFAFNSSSGGDGHYVQTGKSYTYLANGQKVAGGYGASAQFATYGASYSTGVTIGVALDMDSGSIEFFKNNVSQGVAYTGIDTTLDYIPYAGYWIGAHVNFGQFAFTYTPPTGFKSLNTTNIQALGTTSVGKAAITPNKWFDIVRYPGSGVSRNIEVGFEPDIVIAKSIDYTYDWQVYDSKRGPAKALLTNDTRAEDSWTDGLTEFRSDGFALGTNARTNGNGYAYAAWNWRESVDAGLNIITYTGTGANDRAISHNLGKVPDFILTKSRANAYNWDIYHKSLGIGATMTFGTADGTRNVNAYGTIAPTASNFYTYNNFTNTSGYLYVSYLWTEIPGFSKFGRYVANNNASGPFVYCGFKPKIVIIRSTTGSREWNVWDLSRHKGYNLYGPQLDFGNNHAEYDSSGYNDVLEFLSNGFKLRSTASPNYNANTETYVYAAFAESPFTLNSRAF